MLPTSSDAKVTVPYVTFEVTTRCNLKCVMCPHGLPEGYPGQRDADEDLLDSIIGSLGRMDIIRPVGVGEPMLAAGFWRIVDALRGRSRPELSFITNGILLTETNVRRLSEVPISNIQISVDAVRPTTHARIRGNELSRTLKGIENLARMRSILRKPFSILMSFVIMKENYLEAPDFVEMAANMGADHVCFEHLTPLMTDPGKWRVVRDNWTFNYGAQDMRNAPAASDDVMSEVLDRADALGIGIISHYLFFDPEREARSLQRPCRRRPLEGKTRYELVGAGA